QGRDELHRRLSRRTAQPELRRRLARAGDLDLGHEARYPALDLVADRSRRLDGLPDRVLKRPVLVLLAGHDWTLVAAAHPDHEVGPVDVARIKPARHTPGEVDANLVHRLGDVRMHLARRPRAGRPGLAPGALEERVRHLRASGIAHADEQDSQAASDRESSSTASGTSR